MVSQELHADVVQFIESRIDTVPHMEALVLLWEDRETKWNLEQVAARLYLSDEATASILADLVRHRLVRVVQAENDTIYSYDDGWEKGGNLMRNVVLAFRRHLAQVTGLIHSSPSAAVRDFARAFRLKKD